MLFSFWSLLVALLAFLAALVLGQGSWLDDKQRSEKCLLMKGSRLLVVLCTATGEDERASTEVFVLHSGTLFVMECFVVVVLEKEL